MDNYIYIITYLLGNFKDWKYNSNNPTSNYNYL